MPHLSEKKPKRLTLTEAGQLQRKVFLTLTKLHLLQQDAMTAAEQETIQLTTELIDNTSMYAMFLEEYMTPGLQSHTHSDPDAPGLINQIRDHCRIVDAAYREKSVAGTLAKNSKASTAGGPDEKTEEKDGDGD